MNWTLFKLIVITLFYLTAYSDATVEKYRVVNAKPEIEKEQEMNKLRHLVLFKFKESATSSDILKVEEAFTALPLKIEQIKGFEWGINISPENLNKGFTHGFLLTFSNEKERDLYLPHPDHKAFVKLLEPFLEDVLVVDYWAN